MRKQAAPRQAFAAGCTGEAVCFCPNYENMNKRLTRPRNGRMIGGVCAGIGEYLGLDPTVVRIIYVLLSIGAIGTPILVYLILCLIIPES